MGMAANSKSIVGRKENKEILPNVRPNISLYGTQNKKKYALNQSYERTSAVLPDMGQMEKERGESHEWALMFMLPVSISC
jgi:hypothetical protein